MSERVFPKTIYTVGHSNLSIEQFLRLLAQHGIEVVVDVRSAPYSRYTPHFNHDALASTLSNQEGAMERTWANLMDLSDEETYAWHRRWGTNIQVSPQNVMAERIRRDNNAAAKAQIELARQLGRMTGVIMWLTLIIAVLTLIVVIDIIVRVFAL